MSGNARRIETMNRRPTCHMTEMRENVYRTSTATWSPGRTGCLVALGSDPFLVCFVLFLFRHLPCPIGGAAVAPADFFLPPRFLPFPPVVVGNEELDFIDEDESESVSRVFSESPEAHASSSWWRYFATSLPQFLLTVFRPSASAFSTVALSFPTAPSTGALLP